MNNLAGTLWAQGDFAGARELQQTALAVSRRVLGDEHPDTLMSMHSLAVTLWETEEHPEAIRLMRQAAAQRKTKLGAAHPDTRASAVSLARMLAGAPSATPPAFPPHPEIATTPPVLSPPAPGWAAKLRRAVGWLFTGSP